MVDLDCDGDILLCTYAPEPDATRPPSPPDSGDVDANADVDLAELDEDCDDNPGATP